MLCNISQRIYGCVIERRWIVDDVVAKVKPEFASEGLEE